MQKEVMFIKKIMKISTNNISKNNFLMVKIKILIN